MTGPGPRIALCHLESLVGLPALNLLFDEIGDRVDLVIVSRRFGPKHGGIVRQFVNGVRRSGLRMTFWLGLDIISAQVASHVASMVSGLTGRAPSLRSVRALADRYGARFLLCADANSGETIQAVCDAGIDLVLVMNFDQILQRNFIATPRYGVVNLHPSLLPMLRGPCPAFWALAQGERRVGVTLHVIDSAQIDAGPILGQATMTVDACTSVAEVTSSLFLEGARLVRPAVCTLAKGGLSGAPQVLDQATYRGFPDRVEMAAAHHVRLCRLRHLARLFTAACGLKSWRP